jgi:hypothetical protein
MHRLGTERVNGVAASAVPKLLSLDAACPYCGHGPRLRIEPWVRVLFRGASQNAVVATYQCHRPRCGQVYAVRVYHFVGAA